MLPQSNISSTRQGTPMQFARRQPPAQAPATTPYFAHKPTQVEAFRQGYPRLAAFINCDRDFVAFRKFGRLQARVILSKQDELIALEEKLHRVDNKEPNAYLLTTRRGDTTTERSQLLAEIENKLLEYHQCVNMYYGDIERQTTKTTNVRNLSKWLTQNKPVVLEESKFLDDWDDLISPNSANDRGGLNSLIEGIVAFLDKIRLGKLLIKMRWTSTDHSVILFNASHVSILARALAAFLASLILTAPVAGLYLVKKLSTRLWIVAICTAIFSTVISSFTHSRNFEIFSATAAYCAVLVVFVGNLPVSN